MDKTVLLHYLLDDHPRRAAKARRIIAGGAARVYPETVVATVEALERDYGVPRSLIGTVMALLADDVSMEDGAAVRLAARLYGTGRLTFAESLLAARNILTGYPIETFSKSLVKARDVAAKAVRTAPIPRANVLAANRSPIPANAPAPVARAVPASSMADAGTARATLHPWN